MNVLPHCVLPHDILNHIYDWLREFHRAESTSRVRIFQNMYGSIWSSVCEDIRMNTPMYSLHLPYAADIHLFSICSPDCNPDEFIYFQDRMRFVTRRAISVVRDFYRAL
jgi:hypothetical protein